MYALNPFPKFIRKARKLFKKSPLLKSKLGVVFDILQEQPFSRLLQTHKVIDVNGQTSFSSRIDGNLRVIWRFNKEKVEIIDLIDIGGHSGKRKVYK